MLTRRRRPLTHPLYPCPPELARAYAAEFVMHPLVRRSPYQGLILWLAEHARNPRRGRRLRLLAFFWISLLPLAVGLAFFSRLGGGGIEPVIAIGSVVIPYILLLAVAERDLLPRADCGPMARLPQDMPSTARIMLFRDLWMAGLRGRDLMVLRMMSTVFTTRRERWVLEEWMPRALAWGACVLQAILVLRPSSRARGAWASLRLQIQSSDGVLDWVMLRLSILNSPGWEEIPRAVLLYVGVFAIMRSLVSIQAHDLAQLGFMPSEDDPEAIYYGPWEPWGRRFVRGLWGAAKGITVFVLSILLAVGVVVLLTWLGVLGHLVSWILGGWGLYLLAARGGMERASRLANRRTLRARLRLGEPRWNESQQEMSETADG